MTEAEAIRVTVSWWSKSAGKTKHKRGEILAYLPPGWSVGPYVGDLPKSRVMVQRSTYVSRVPRYAVMVHNLGLPRLYAPLASVVEDQNPHLTIAQLRTPVTA